MQAPFFMPRFREVEMSEDQLKEAVEARLLRLARTAEHFEEMGVRVPVGLLYVTLDPTPGDGPQVRVTPFCAWERDKYTPLQILVAATELAGKEPPPVPDDWFGFAFLVPHAVFAVTRTRKFHVVLRLPSEAPVPGIAWPPDERKQHELVEDATEKGVLTRLMLRLVDSVPVKTS